MYEAKKPRQRLIEEFAIYMIKAFGFRFAALDRFYRSDRPLVNYHLSLKFL
jgi:hypothetical protein